MVLHNKYKDVYYIIELDGPIDLSDPRRPVIEVHKGGGDFWKARTIRIRFELDDLRRATPCEKRWVSGVAYVSILKQKKKRKGVRQ